MEADGAPGDQDGGGWRTLSGAEEAVPEDEKYEVRRCMCQERNWRDVVRSTSLAESAPRELSECWSLLNQGRGRTAENLEGKF